LTWTCVPPLWKMFRHPCRQRRARFPIWLFWRQILKFSLFLNTFGFFSGRKAWFWQNIVWAVYSLQISADGSLWPCSMHRILQRFYCCPKTIGVVDKKQMYNSVIRGKQNASKEWYCIISMFLTSFNVYFAFGYACFMCICLKTAIWLFLGERSGFFWWKQVSNPCVGTKPS